MTIHCAIMYFDQSTHSAGFLIGSDSALVAKSAFNNEISDLELEVDKSIRGKNTIGFMRGKIRLQAESNDPARIQPAFYSILRTLDAYFDDIHDGASYHFMSSMISSRHVILLGKYTPENLSLYTISNMRTRGNSTAILLYTITSHTYIADKESIMWYAPLKKDYIVFSFKDRLTRQEAQTRMERLLKLDSDVLRDAFSVGTDYRTGRPVIYDLSFSGIQYCGADIIASRK